MNSSLRHISQQNKITKMSSQEVSTQSSSEENTTLRTLNNKTDKEKLLEDITNLKALCVDVKLSLEYYRSMPECSQISFVNNKKKSSRLHQISEAVGIINEELFRYAGINCTKFDMNKECIFEFHSSMNGANDETYFVQILMQEGKGKLGFWKMPLLLDATEIVSNCPVDDLKQVKNFVRLCKLYLDCRKNRQMQFEKFKECVQVFDSYSVQTNPEVYTNVQLHVFKLREIENDNFYDIVLYIFYKLNETRPTKLIPDSLHENTLPTEVIGKLNVFFKKFMLLELQPAFEQILDEENGKLFRCKKSFKDKDFVTEAGENDSDSVSQEEEDISELTEIRSFTDETENKKSGRQKEKMDEGENPSDKKVSKKVNNSRKLKSNFEVTRKVQKIRFEENNNKEREHELEAPNQEKESEEIKKIPRKVKAKVFKAPKISGKQTKLNFLKNKDSFDETLNLNSDTKELEQKEEDEEKMDGGKDQAQNPENNIEGKEFEENPKDKRKTVRRLQKQSTKKNFLLSNFVLQRKFVPTNKEADLIETISPGENMATSSTPIAKRKPTPLQMETDISEIIKANKPVHKASEKRSRSESSDSNLEEVVDEFDKSLLNNLTEVQEKIVKSSSENPKKKSKKSTKRVKKGIKKKK